MGRRTLVLVCITVLLVGLQNVALAGPWLNHNLDPAHTSNNATENFSPLSLQLVWDQYIGNTSGFITLPAIWQGRMLVTAGNALRSYNIATGDLNWEQFVDTIFVATGPVISGNRLFVGTQKFPAAQIYAYDVSTGTPIWASAPTGDKYSIGGPPVVAETGLVYAGAGGVGVELFAFSTADGSVVWQVPVLGGGIPAVEGGRVFTASPGHYYAFDALTGAIVWHRSLNVSGGSDITPAVGSLAYIVDNDYLIPSSPPALFALDKSNGAVIWTNYYPFFPAGVAVTSTAVFVVTGEGLVALNPMTGELLWNFAPEGGLAYPPVVAGNYIFVASTGTTYAIHIPTRTVVWSTDMGGWLIIGEGTVLINNGGIIRAYRRSTLTVSIDIRPGGTPNAINTRSEGLISVAILASATFDAATINAQSVKFGRTGDEASLAFCGGLEDVNRDGYADRVCHFHANQTGFQAGDTRGILKGSTIVGTLFWGMDAVQVVGH